MNDPHNCESWGRVGRVVAWFSCGAASAVAAKLCIKKYGERACVVYCDTMKDEHPDQQRFFDDVQRWLGREIIRIRSTKYNSVDEVFRKTRYMAGINGARCTVEMKKVPRFEFQLPDDVHVFGLTADEPRRIERFTLQNPELACDWILADKLFTKTRCLNVLRDAGIALPAMYRLGFENNNCIGCVKATSATYWRRVRREFPAIFARRATLSRELGVRLTRINGERVFLDELPSDADSLWTSIPTVTESVSCGPECGAVDGAQDNSYREQLAPL